jgi:chromosome segregation ATPase
LQRSIADLQHENQSVLGKTSLLQDLIKTKEEPLKASAAQLKKCSLQLEDKLEELVKLEENLRSLCFTDTVMHI